MFRKLAGLTVVAGLFIAGSASAQIAGSAHDFTAAGWSGGEMCLACHTTHNTNTAISEAPLWNRAVTTATYVAYTSTTLDATDAGGPTGTSLLCMSCHDGTVALDSYGADASGNYVDDGSTFMTGLRLVGTNLQNDHPIGFTYNAALVSADGGGLKSQADAGVIALLDASSRVQCTSCHDVHDDSNNNFLVMSNAGSALCNTCHTK